MMAGYWVERTAYQSIIATGSTDMAAATVVQVLSHRPHRVLCRNVDTQRYLRMRPDELRDRYIPIPRLSK